MISMKARYKYLNLKYSKPKNERLDTHNIRVWFQSLTLYKNAGWRETRHPLHSHTFIQESILLLLVPPPTLDQSQVIRRERPTKSNHYRHLFLSVITGRQEGIQEACCELEELVVQVGCPFFETT